MLWSCDRKAENVRTGRLVEQCFLIGGLDPSVVVSWLRLVLLCLSIISQKENFFFGEAYRTAVEIFEKEINDERK